MDEGEREREKGKNLDGSGIILAYLTLLLPLYFLPFRSASDSLSVSHPYSRLGSSISASIENSFHPSDPMANLPFHLIPRCRLRYPLC